MRSPLEQASGIIGEVLHNIVNCLPLLHRNGLNRRNAMQVVGKLVTLIRAAPATRDGCADVAGEFI